MKGRSVILGDYKGREAAALMIDGQLEDLLIDPRDRVPLPPGAICRGMVGRQMKGQGGVFVDLPGGARGFLRTARGLNPGRTVICMVTGVAEPGKAVPISLRVLFKSRHVIVTPGVPGLNISRRIRDESLRKELSVLAAARMEGARMEGARMEGAEMDETGMGLILRSAAMIAEPDEIGEDITTMRELAAAVMADDVGGPELLVDAPTPHEEAWRDWAEPAPDAVIAGDFADHGVLDAIDALLGPRVALSQGAHMWIEPTRALIAVDVNTGNDTTPAASLKANIAAVHALPRQLRLRGLGGQVVVDFAPMPRRNRSALEQQMKAAFKGEPEATLSGWTPLGNFEMQRKRDRVTLGQLIGG